MAKKNDDISSTSVKIQKPSSSKLKKVLLILFLALVAGGLSIYVYLRNKNSNTTNTEEEKIAIFQKNTEAVDNLAGLANGKDKNKTIEASIEIATNESQVLVSRLDAYRVCLQTAIEIKDKETQKKCYDGAIKLLESSNDEAFKKDWTEYLNKINSGQVTTSGDDDVVQ